MPRRALPSTVYSSSPSRLSCLAVLTAAWGSHSFRPPLLRTAVAAAAAGRVTTAALIHGKDASRLAAGAVSNQRRQPICSSLVSPSAKERPWLGNGPDPMTKTDQIRPGTRESLAARGVGRGGGEGGRGAVGAAAEERVWLGNGPDPLASLEAAAVAVVGGGDRGDGVPAEEMWLNGPFKAPLLPGPLVS